MDELHPPAHSSVRIAPGELAPAGECPSCRQLVGIAGSDVPEHTLTTCAEVMKARGWRVVHPAGDEAAHAESILDLGSKRYTAFVKASVQDEHGSGPSWARFTISQQFINLLTGMRNAVIAHQLAYAESWYAPQWEEGTNLEIDRVCVSATHFHWDAAVKHNDYHVQTDEIGFKELEGAVAKATEKTPLFFGFGVVDADTRQACLDTLELFEQAA